MKIRLIIIMTLLLSLFLNSKADEANRVTSLFSLSNTDGANEKSVGKLFSKDGVIVLDDKTEISGISVSGYIIQPESDSFVRIVLEDIRGKQYVVVESSRLYNDLDSVELSKYCEETRSLFSIVPKKLSIYTQNASIYISKLFIQSSADLKNKYPLSDKDANESRLKQVKYKAEKINEYNQTHGKLWRASPTDISLLPWDLRKKVLGIDESSNTNGFEFYSSGIFEVGEPSQSQELRRTSTSTTVVDSFDWRNRHGINWMTSVKNQSPGNGCWAFTAVGITEALVNLYFNRKLDYDLSEQEVISCSSCGSNAGGGWPDSALSWISGHGVSEETSFPFTNTDEPCSNMGSFNESVKVGAVTYVSNYTTNNYEAVKKALIAHGPLCSGFQYSGTSSVAHAMPLVGYGVIHAGDTIRYFASYNQNQNNFVVIHEGDSRIGKTYWIFKNSYGEDFYCDHAGYAYILFNTPQCFRSPYYVSTPVTSLMYDDEDIAITDTDGDGYYFWGIGSKPAHCPSWIPNEPDGDDSNYRYGPMDENGNLYDIQAHVNDVVNVSSNTTWNKKRYIYNNIVISNGATLTITNEATCYNGAKISIVDGTLHIKGGKLNEANINVVNPLSSKVKISENGEVYRAKSKELYLPLGAKLEITSGYIN